MKTLTRDVIEARVMKHFKLGPSWRTSTDSSVWIAHKIRPLTVLKVSQLNLEALLDHKEMMKLGKKLRHVAQVIDVRPLCFAPWSTKHDPWVFCLIFQKFIVEYRGVKHIKPPARWELEGQLWIQHDAKNENAVGGLWVDVARVQRVKAPIKKSVNHYP